MSRMMEIKNNAKLMVSCNSANAAPSGGSMVLVKRLGGVEALKPGEAVPPTKAAFMESTWATSGMAGDDVSSAGWLEAEKTWWITPVMACTHLAHIR